MNEIKIIVLRECDVGKTSIINQFTEKKFDDLSILSSGLYAMKEMEIEDKKLKLK